MHANRFMPSLNIEMAYAERNFWEFERELQKVVPEIWPIIAERQWREKAGECWSSPSEREMAKIGDYEHGLVDISWDGFQLFWRIWNNQKGVWLNY